MSELSAIRRRLIAAEILIDKYQGRLSTEDDITIRDALMRAILTAKRARTNYLRDIARIEKEILERLTLL